LDRNYGFWWKQLLLVRLGIADCRIGHLGDLLGSPIGPALVEPGKSLVTMA